MWNRYQPYRSGIRFFPHIVPIVFPLIFPLGLGLAWLAFNVMFNVLGILLLAAVVLFIIRAIKLGSSGAAWNSMKNSGNQWQQRFTSRQQSPYYQPRQQSPYYQPSSTAGKDQSSQPYAQGYQADDSSQPQTQYPEQMPPMQQ
jgi:hypothetical protein